MELELTAEFQKRTVFVTGGTGYLGRPLIAELLRRGHKVRALGRAGSESKLPAGCQVITGDALDSRSYREQIAPADTYNWWESRIPTHQRQPSFVTWI